MPLSDNVPVAFVSADQGNIKLEEGVQMAIIDCPFCGKQISDKATECVHCGAAIPVEGAVGETPDQVARAACPECGNPVDDGAQACPNCGFPVAPAAPEAQGDQPEEPAPETASADGAKGLEQRKVKSKTLLIVIAAAVVVIAAIVIGFAVSAHQEQVRKDEEAAAAQAAAEKEEADRKAAHNQYIDDLNTSMMLMLSGAAAAEDLGNITNNVWHSAIWERSEDGWDESIRKYYSDDFNDALSKLYADPDTVNAVKNIKSNQDEVSALDKKLKDPPEGFANAYSAYEDMHDAYIKLTKLATSPTGSYQTYSSDFRQADSACVEAYEKLKTRIPEKE